MYKYTPVDPVRYPKIQTKLEEEVKKNFRATLDVITVKIAKILKNGTSSNS